jgi:AraC-like DNA-binding protein
LFNAVSAVSCHGTTAPLNVDDLILYRSDRPGVGALSVTVHEFPAEAPTAIIPEQAAYSFWYRARVEKGDTRATAPELALSGHRICRDHVLVSPPSLPLYGHWERAAGRVARFSFSPRFFEAAAAEAGLPGPGLKRFWHAFFPIDRQLDALCRLLMQETEGQCPHGRRYFEALGEALALGVLSAVRDQPSAKRPWAVPPGIHRVVQSLETDFTRDFSLAELAAQAQLSRGYFAQAFRQLTGDAPHQYLLQVRLSHARQLLAQNNPALSLGEIAASCGFSDQAHLSRHFRRFFGTTPAAFRRQRRP